MLYTVSGVISGIIISNWWKMLLQSGVVLLTFCFKVGQTLFQSGAEIIISSYGKVILKVGQLFESRVKVISKRDSYFRVGQAAISKWHIYFKKGQPNRL